MAQAGVVEHHSKKSGLPPGTLVHIGQRLLDEPRITAIEYNESVHSSRVITDLAELRAHPDQETVLWVNVDGIHDPRVVEQLGELFKLHPLVREDVMNAELRPKLEEYDDCYFIVLKMLDYDEQAQRIMVEQISIVLGEGFVLTFQERKGDVFDGVRARIRENAGRIRKNKADYLTYRLIDAIVDHYFVALEAMSEFVEEVEEQVAEDPIKVDARDLHTLKREAVYLRRMIGPARELLGTIARIEDDPLLRPATMPYFRDVYDHVVQVSETVETIRDILSSMIDVYHSAISNRQNEVMKVLAIVSSIFIPLSFIAGVYGMNFEHMPELHIWWAYPAVLALMGLIGGGIALYTKRKRWW
jgi:magnesium transporter